MADTQQYPSAAAGFVPTEEQVDGVLAWFAEYDANAAAGEVERMADMAVFPVNVVSDSDDGGGPAKSWTREEFVRRMREQGAGQDGIEMQSHRTPVFVNENLVFVVTDATFTVDGQTHAVRYGDLLVRTGDRWAFQTMVSGSFGAA